MNMTTRPAHLSLIVPGEPVRLPERPRPLIGKQGRRRLPFKAGVAAVLERRDLFDAIERIGALAPGAPLSFLAVRVSALEEATPTEVDLTLRLLAGRLSALTRATDHVGRMGIASFGVILQGTGVTAASAVAARLAHHLNVAARAVDPALKVTVGAATGTGLNWSTLPVAATNSLPDAG